MDNSRITQSRLAFLASHCVALATLFGCNRSQYWNDVYGNLEDQVTESLPSAKRMIARTQTRPAIAITRRPETDYFLETDFSDSNRGVRYTFSLEVHVKTSRDFAEVVDAGEPEFKVVKLVDEEPDGPAIRSSRVVQRWKVTEETFFELFESDSPVDAIRKRLENR